MNKEIGLPPELLNSIKDPRQDGSELLASKPTHNDTDVTPRDLLKFAKLILAVIAILFILSAITEMLRPANGVFEICKTILPSMAMLVIGYYFGSAKN